MPTVATPSRRQATRRAYGASYRAGTPGEDGLDEEEALELPVEPDEGMPIIPDDERVVDVPS
jgi:hypothetical protein